jgi:hypothetical protein
MREVAFLIVATNAKPGTYSLVRNCRLAGGLARRENHQKCRQKHGGQARALNPLVINIAL